MDLQLFHIFRNTPFGRETFLQSLHFCKTIGVSPLVYIPRHTKFLMYFDNDVVQVDLDASYLTAPDTAQDHAQELLDEMGLTAQFFEPKNFTASTLPDVPVNFDFMACPRSISDLSSKIGLGYIGPRVRRIVQSARFPVMITNPDFRLWNSVTVCFGGSANAVKSLKLGLRICKTAGLPLDLFTQAGDTPQAEYQKTIDERGLTGEFNRHLRHWHFFEQGKMEENLYAVRHDALVVMGAYGHGLLKELVFGSMMELIQSTLPNNLIVVGPRYSIGG